MIMARQQQELADFSDARAPSTKEILLDPRDLEFDEGGGVRGWYWPLSRAQELHVAESFQSGIKSLIEGSSADRVDLAVIHAGMSDLAREVTTAFRSVAVARRYRANNREPISPAGYRILSAVLNNAIPEPPAVVRALANGLAAPALGRRFLRECRNLLHRHDWFQHSSMLRADMAHDVISIGVSPLMEMHARAIGASPHIVPLWEWFNLSPAMRAELLSYRPNQQRSIQQLIQLIRQSFSKGEEELSSNIEEYFRRWLTEYLRMARYHYERLVAVSRRLPSILWAGGTNSVWSRILRRAVQDSGGKVVVHDHGKGAGQISSMQNVVYRCDLANEMYTFSENQAKALRNLLDLHDCVPLSGNLRTIAETPRARSQPLIRYHCESDFKWQPIKPSSNSPVFDRILYVSQHYPGEEISTLCPPPGPVIADWQTSILAQLKKWGMRVAFKPHPESFTEHPQHWLRDHDIQIVNGRFEQIVEPTDILIFDVLSSPFAAATQRVNPIIVLNFGLLRFFADVRALIEKRCAIVDCGFTQHTNLAEIDWNQLRGAFGAAASRRLDKSCALELFG
jgi:hypothetical protein